MAVYMIQAGGNGGPVKLGHGDPYKRRAGLQVGNHLELRIIRVFHGGMKEERQLHRLFSDLEIRGEWYSFSKAMLGDVGLTEVTMASIMPPPKSLNWREWTEEERAAAAARQLAISADPERRAARLAKLRATCARKAEQDKLLNLGRIAA